MAEREKNFLGQDNTVALDLTKTHAVPFDKLHDRGLYPVQARKFKIGVWTWKGMQILNSKPHHLLSSAVHISAIIHIASGVPYA